LAKKFDTKEFNKDLIASALEKAGITVKDFEIGIEKDLYESDFKPEFIIESEELIITDPEKQEAFKALEELWDSYERGRSSEKDKKDRPFDTDSSKEGNINSTGEEALAAAGPAAKGGRPKKKVGKIILTVLLVLLACELVILGIKIFAPDSAAAKFITEKLNFTVTWLDDYRQEPTFAGKEFLNVNGFVLQEG